MFTLTTPRAILLGFLAVALAVSSIPFGMKLMNVNAQQGITKVALCSANNPNDCVSLFRAPNESFSRLFVTRPSGF